MDTVGKKYLVLGAGVSGQAAANALIRQGAEVVLNDVKPLNTNEQNLSKLSRMGVKIISGYQDESLLYGIDGIIISPGIPLSLPVLNVARLSNIEIISEIELAYRMSEAPILAITGTNGKTTTTTLLGEMLQAAGIPVAVGGNIGVPLTQEVHTVGKNGFIVAEISSFQLEGVSNFRPRAAAILNITPDHMDRHGTIEEYRNTKAKIFARQGMYDYAVLNHDDPQVRTLADKLAGQPMFFSRMTQPAGDGCYVAYCRLWLKYKGQTQCICATNEIKLLGEHNIENALAACCLAAIAGVKPETMAEVLRSFTGVEHRIEYVAAIDGIEYYNDSKATNPESSIKALEAFNGNIVLIAGGRDKNTDLGEIMTLARQKVDHLVLIGEAQERFAAQAEKYGINNIHRATNLEEAVTKAHLLAVPPQIVLLSPACASYDMFDNYEQRGRVFKELVMRLA